MARVTNENCLKRVSDRFWLVMLASERTRQLNAGAKSEKISQNDKNTVVALREIAACDVDPSDLERAIILRYKRDVGMMPDAAEDGVVARVGVDTDEPGLESVLGVLDDDVVEKIDEVSDDLELEIDPDLLLDGNIGDSDDIDDEGKSSIDAYKERFSDSSKIYSDEEVGPDD